MTPPEPAAIKPEAKKVNVAAKPGKAAAAQTRAARARIDRAESARRSNAVADETGTRMGITTYSSSLSLHGS